MKQLEIKVDNYSTPKHLHKEYCKKNASRIYECYMYSSRICMFSCRYAKVMNRYKLEADQNIINMAGQSLECV